MRGATRPDLASRARRLHPRSDAGVTGDRAAHTKTLASGSKTPRRRATRDVASSAGSARMLLTRNGQPVRRSDPKTDSRDPSSQTLSRNRPSGQRLAGRSTRRASRGLNPGSARRARPTTGRGPNRRGHSTQRSSRSSAPGSTRRARPTMGRGPGRRGHSTQRSSRSPAPGSTRRARPTMGRGPGRRGHSTQHSSRSPAPGSTRRARPTMGREPGRRGHSTRGSNRSLGLNPRQRRKPGRRSDRSHGDRSSPDPSRESDPRLMLASEQGRNGTGNPNEHHVRPLPPTARRHVQSSTRRSRRSLAERAFQRDAGFDPSIRVVVGLQRAVAPEKIRGLEAGARDRARSPLHATAEPSSR